MSEAKEKRLVLEVVGRARGVIELPRQGVMTLGSAAQKADVALDGAGIADVHCAIGRIKGGGWALKDLGSPAGTIVNGERVQQRRLEEGDELLLGSQRVRVIDPERAAAATVVVEKEREKPAEKRADPVRAITSTQVAAQTLPQVRGYRIERPLGRGAMGEVYLAVQESLDRQVALKVLSSKLSADADFVKRFQFEARAAAALNHPNVVTVHDVWEESGRHFLAMEYMDKGNLEGRVARDGRIGEREALEIFADMAKALVYAELRGIVHRDIKPANLMQNSAGTSKLADLGLATHLEAEATESDNKKIFGTPHFISPEQARGEKVDGRADLYSLGATMYRLLTGRTPFEGATTRDILRGHFFETPKRPSELVRDLSPQIDAIVMRLLEKKPEARFANAGALLQELERLKSVVMHGAPAAPPPAKSKLGLWLGLAGAAAAAIAVALLVGGDDEKPDGGGAPTNAQTNSPRTTPRLPKTSGNSGATTPDETGDGKPSDSNAQPVRPRDSDAELKARELEAENAYLRLPAELTTDVRRDELIRLSERYAGTTAAGRFTEEVARLDLEISRSANATTERDAVRKQALDQLKRASLSGDVALPLDQALSAMLAQPLPIELASDAAYLTLRRQVLLDVVRSAHQRGSAALERADELARKGQFDAIPSELKPWTVSLVPPDTSTEPGLRESPEFREIDDLRARIGERLDKLEFAKIEFASSTLAQDGAALARGLRGASGVESALREFALESAAQRLSALEGTLRAADAQTFVRELREQLVAGKRAVDVLSASFAQGAWRRKSVPDPRSRTRASRETVAVTPQGIEVKVDAATELLPWSVFAARPDELHQLFDKRLTREWTRDEQIGIDALVRIAAVLQAVDEAAEMFVGGTSSVFSEEESRTLTEGFGVARTWAELAGTTAQLERESGAAKVLAEALRAASDGAWTVCVASLERLSGEFRTTLLVRLLSDGSVAAPLAPPPDDDGEDGEDGKDK